MWVIGVMIIANIDAIKLFLFFIKIIKVAMRAIAYKTSGRKKW